MGRESSLDDKMPIPTRIQFMPLLTRTSPKKEQKRPAMKALMIRSPNARLPPLCADRVLQWGEPTKITLYSRARRGRT